MRNICMRVGKSPGPTAKALLSSLVLLLPTVVYAQTNPIFDRLKKAACSPIGPFNCSGLDDAQTSGLRRAAQIGGIILGSLLAFLGIVFLVLMIYAGLQWMTARGNEQQVEKAKKTIEHTAIGLLIVVLAYALVTLASTLIGKIGVLKT